jgi:iron complex outermembrane recepter protein
MKKTYFTAILFFILSFVSLSAGAQGSITGKITDDQTAPLVGASVRIKDSNIGSVTDANGAFTIQNVANGTYTLVVSFIGFETITQSITVSGGAAKADFTLGEDVLGMSEIVVTGIFDPRTKLESSVAITTLKPQAIEQRAPRSTGDLLQAIPGTFVDNSAGEIDNRVHSRGLSVGRGGQGTGFISVKKAIFCLFFFKIKIIFNEKNLIFLSFHTY